MESMAPFYAIWRTASILVLVYFVMVNKSAFRYVRLYYIKNSDIMINWWDTNLVNGII